MQTQIRYEMNLKKFEKLPCDVFAYWVSDSFINIFPKTISLGTLAYPRQGMATTNNSLFLRQWYEVECSNIGFDLNDEQETIGDIKWFPYNKGGEFRKWYGNNDYVVNFKNKGKEVCDYIDRNSAVDHKGRVINRDRYFKPNITWSKISSGDIAFRFKDHCIFDVAGTSIFGEISMLESLICLLNSKLILYVLKCLSPTLNYEVGQICSIPINSMIFDDKKIIDIALNNIDTSKKDWDSFETSWDFKKHPLI